MGAAVSCQCAHAAVAAADGTDIELDGGPLRSSNADLECKPGASPPVPSASSRSTATPAEEPKACSLPSPLQSGVLVLGRYRLLGDEPLGEGGWCVVWRAEDKDASASAGHTVAVKTYRDQLLREVHNASLGDRFDREVATFRRLGAARPDAKASDAAEVAMAGAGAKDPSRLLVNLLDLSPGRAPDGRYYSVLELAEESLEAWMQKRPAGVQQSLAAAKEVGVALSAGLAWLHSCGLCHLDVKPANVLRFAGLWKLIDLEGAVELPKDKGASDPGSLPLEGFTPLYAPPEVAQAALRQKGVTAPVLLNLHPAASMDVWSAGVVLLDVLAGQAAFEETFSGFQAQALMSFDLEEDEGGALFEWYGFLADQAPLRLADYLPTALAAAAVEAKLGTWLEQDVLSKDPARRPSAAQCAEFLQGLVVPPEGQGVAPSPDESGAQGKLPATTPPEAAGDKAIAGLVTADAADKTGGRGDRAPPAGRAGGGDGGGGGACCLCLRPRVRD